MSFLTLLRPSRVEAAISPSMAALSMRTPCATTNVAPPEDRSETTKGQDKGNVSHTAANEPGESREISVLHSRLYVYRPAIQRMAEWMLPLPETPSVPGRAFGGVLSRSLTRNSEL